MTRAIVRMLAALLVGACLIAQRASAAEEKILNLYNWSDYFAPDTLSAFEKETGIKVRYDTYDSDETLQAKLMTGDSGYDLVWPTNDFMARQIQVGAFRELDKRRLPNLKHLDPALLALAAQADPGNRHGVPYMWGTIGIGYDRAKVGAMLGKDFPKDSLDLVFDPAIASRIAAHCRIGLPDSASMVLPLALRYIGRDPVNPSAADYEAAEAMLMKVRPSIALFVTSSDAHELVDGELCVMVGYSGAIDLGAEKARQLSGKRDIVYDMPSIGTLMWFDSMAIPKTARHPENAHRFIDYILRPDVVARISNAKRYANANRDASAYLDAKLRTNPAIYPGEAVRKTLFTPMAEPPALSRLQGRLWTKFKAALR